MEVNRRAQAEIDEERRKLEEEAKNNPLARLMGVAADNEAAVKQDKLADGFVRSKRN